MNGMFGVYPAIVKSYDADKRTCRVEIEGLTSGGDVFPEAEINYPIGDRAKQENGKVSTEIEILPGDLVNVMFLGGDPDFPLIMGYRANRSGNANGTRRFHHANIELLADNNLKLQAANVTVIATEKLKLQAADIEISADNSVKISSTSLTHNDVDISDEHKHGGVQTGSGNTGTPI